MYHPVIFWEPVDVLRPSGSMGQVTYISTTVIHSQYHSFLEEETAVLPSGNLT